MPADGSATDIRNLKLSPVVHFTKRWLLVDGLALVAAALGSSVVCTLGSEVAINLQRPTAPKAYQLASPR